MNTPTTVKTAELLTIVMLNKLRCRNSNFQQIRHYENTPIQIYWKFYHQKKWKFSDKNSDIFRISTQNIDCGYSLEPPRRGGSNEYPQSMFLSRNKKNNAYPCKPQFYYIKMGFKGSKLKRRVFVMLLDPDYWYKFTYWEANSEDPDQLASSEANWSGSTLFAKAVYMRVQQDKG